MALPIPSLTFTGGSATSGGWGDTGFGDNKVTGSTGNYANAFAYGGSATTAPASAGRWLPWALAAGAALLGFFFFYRK